MKKYILIQNDGEIETNSFELIGASTKRGETGKIGFFGSGLKYSIAYMMRNNIEFKIFSGLRELVFTTVEETLKTQQFKRICINGKETSYTVTMGPTWTKDWFVLREVYCNALDESGCLIVKNMEVMQPSEGKTRIFIELTRELLEVCENWDGYFADERTPIFSTEPVYTCYFGSGDGGIHTQPISVYSKTSGIIYRKGIRVYESKPLMYDYNFQAVDINEDRTAKHPGAISYTIYNLFGTFANEDYIKSILRTGANKEQCCLEYQYLEMAEFHSPVSDKWIEFSENNLLVVREISGKYATEISESKKEVFLVSSTFARNLKIKKPAVKILGMGALAGENAYNEIESSPKMAFLLKEVLESLKEMNYEIEYDISVADFENEATMGCANILEKKIIISSKTFDMGRREIAMTIMEENEHINSRAKDETRKFQDHLFSQWLKYMEESNAIFL